MPLNKTNNIEAQPCNCPDTKSRSAQRGTLPEQNISQLESSDEEILEDFGNLVSVVDFNLRPQWGMCRHFKHQYPACGKCGLAHHRFEICPAYTKRCFSCDKFGHFARPCYTVRSSLIQYYTMEKNLKKLPFSNVRDSAIVNFFDQASPVKVEQIPANIQLQKKNSVISATSNRLKRAQEEIRTLTYKLVESQLLLFNHLKVGQVRTDIAFFTLSAAKKVY
ncbi:unnamed protein product [Mytilus coruscus]|uniref:CCHC-type domain-containing protein n=1 Tax=Mytilus coruscus TaxID=42192 RepID=A0A6J8ANU7_MYTCO|nr:unnamed protein product [Mytilus coruscus]